MKKFYVLLFSIISFVSVDINISYAQSNTLYPKGKLESLSKTDNYYDIEYGYFSDLMQNNVSFEDVKPEYYKNVDLSSIRFYSFRDIKINEKYPAFIALDAINYIDIPTEVFRKYASRKIADSYLTKEKETLPVDKLTYIDISVVEEIPNQLYNVFYITNFAKYRKYFLLCEDGKFLEVNFDLDGNLLEMNAD